MCNIQIKKKGRIQISNPFAYFYMFFSDYLDSIISSFLPQGRLKITRRSALLAPAGLGFVPFQHRHTED